MRGFVGTVIAALALGTAHASAQDAAPDATTPEAAPDASRYPVAYVDRPINLRGGMVRLDARMQQSHVRIATVLGTADASVTQLAFGGAAGLTDRIELSVSHARLTGIEDMRVGGFVYDAAGDYDGNDRVGDVAIAGRYGFLVGSDFDLSGELRVVLPTDGSRPFQFAFGLPARAHLAERFALDLLPEVVLGFGDDPVTGKSETHLAINIPVSGVLQLHRHVFLAGRSGVFWPDFDLEQLYWPGYLEVGGTIAAGDKPVLDVSLQGGFPQLLRPGAPSGDALGTVGTELWVLQLKLQGYLDF